MIPIAKNARGNLGTSPVDRYSLKTGIPINNETKNKNKEIMLKKNNGRSSLIKFTIINKILKPSLNVESLLSEP